MRYRVPQMCPSPSGTCKISRVPAPSFRHIRCQRRQVWLCKCEITHKRTRGAGSLSCEGPWLSFMQVQCSTAPIGNLVVDVTDSVRPRCWHESGLCCGSINTPPSKRHAQQQTNRSSKLPGPGKLKLSPPSLGVGLLYLGERAHRFFYNSTSSPVISSFSITIPIGGKTSTSFNSTSWLQLPLEQIVLSTC